MKSKLLITICIASGVMFIVSGLSKLFPAELFELTIVNAGITGWNYSPYLARIIIAVELFLGIALLQKYYIRVVIGGAVGLLTAFSLHLVYTIGVSGNNGNCGCFGELLPMSPLAALIKNVIFIVLLIYAFNSYGKEENGNGKVLSAILLISFIAVFLISPIQEIQSDKTPAVNYTTPNTSIGAPENSGDSASGDNKFKENQSANDKNKTTSPSGSDGSITNDKPTSPKSGGENNPSTGEDEKTAETKTPVLMKKNSSQFKDFHEFTNSGYVDLDSGIKIAALLSLDCEHCMEAAKEIAALKKKGLLHPVYFLYLGEVEQLDNFFSVTGAEKLPYKIINARTFFTLIENAPPRIVLLNNGNIIGDWTQNFTGSALLDKLKD